MAHKWSARQVLDLDYTVYSCRCSATTTRRTRCLSRTVADQAKAIKYLDVLSETDPVEFQNHPSLPQWTRELAKYTLCNRYHAHSEAQVDTVATKFQQAIQRYAAERHLENERRDLAANNVEVHEEEIVDFVGAVLGMNRHGAEPAVRPIVREPPIGRAVHAEPAMRVQNNDVPVQERQHVAIPRARDHFLLKVLRQSDHGAALFQVEFGFDPLDVDRADPAERILKLIWDSNDEGRSVLIGVIRNILRRHMNHMVRQAVPSPAIDIPARVSQSERLAPRAIPPGVGPDDAVRPPPIIPRRPLHTPDNLRGRYPVRLPDLQPNPPPILFRDQHLHPPPRQIPAQWPVPALRPSPARHAVLSPPADCLGERAVLSNRSPANPFSATAIASSSRNNELLNPALEVLEQHNGIVRKPYLNTECAICMDAPMTKEDSVWCKAQCGKSLHTECFTKDMVYRLRSRDVAKCVYCRALWIQT